jgi:hypothetical protein
MLEDWLNRASLIRDGAKADPERNEEFLSNGMPNTAISSKYNSLSLKLFILSNHLIKNIGVKKPFKSATFSDQEKPFYNL